MGQLRAGFYQLLENPIVYSTVQNILGAKRSRKILVNDHLKIPAGKHVRFLDVGCGPGDILDFLPSNLDYTGVDFEASYIEKAKNRFGSIAKFIHGDITKLDLGDQKFDVIHIAGVLHHLEDFEVSILFQSLRDLLAEDGFLFSLENVYTDDQSKIAKYIISKDRGQNVRTVDGYISLCKKFFGNVQFDIRHDLLRIPYSHIILRCKK